MTTFQTAPVGARSPNSSLAAAGEAIENRVPPMVWLRFRLQALHLYADAVRARDAKAEQIPRRVTIPSLTLRHEITLFDLPKDVRQNLSCDRDSVLRQQKLLKLLDERGSIRLLGAVADAALIARVESLYESHPNFRRAIDYVLGEIALARQQGQALCSLHLLLCGGPGVGKTDFALALSRCLELPLEVISLSAAQASSHLAGSETYWGNSQPGTVWQTLVQGAYGNPIFVLDEIDKTTDRWGDPLGALYQLLEHHSATVFADKSVPWLAVDASHVHWIATANDVTQLHPALRSRFVEIPIGAPSEAAWEALVQRLYGDLVRSYQVGDCFPVVLPESTLRILRERSIRDIKRLLRLALGQALLNDQRELAIPREPLAEDTGPRIGFIVGRASS